MLLLPIGEERGLMLHSVGCPQPSAEVFANNWDKSSAAVCVHAVLQADGTVYQLLPWNWRAWHCGGSGNNTHIGVEMTEPSQIKYSSGATFVCTDVAAAREHVKGCYHTAVELLAGIPSVVYGLVGMIILVPGIQRAFDLPSGATLLAAIIVLTIMILPSIINVSETALRAVPREYEEASMALGATEMETFFRVSLPAAKSGIAASVVLGVGRAIGEAMAIIMVSGNVANLPGLLTSVRFMTTAIASEMAYAAAGSLQQQALFSIGLVLFLFIMMINVFLNVFVKGRRTA